MKKEGDYSYLSKGLYQVVKDSKGENFGTSYEMNGRQGKTLYFKQINAWGDSFRLQEYYNTPHQSVVDNGYEKTIELSDENVISLFKPSLKSKEDNFPEKTLDVKNEKCL
jgi:hypothetical protein